jgi:hypothetical protein
MTSQRKPHPVLGIPLGVVLCLTLGACSKPDPNSQAERFRTAVAAKNLPVTLSSKDSDIDEAGRAACTSIETTGSAQEFEAMLAQSRPELGIQTVDFINLTIDIYCPSVRTN